MSIARTLVYLSEAEANMSCDGDGGENKATARSAIQPERFQIRFEGIAAAVVFRNNDRELQGGEVD